MLWKCYLHELFPATIFPAPILGTLLNVKARLLAGWAASSAQNGVPVNLTDLSCWVLQAAHSIILSGFDAKKSMSPSRHIWFAVGAATSEYYSLIGAERDAGAHTVMTS